MTVCWYSHNVCCSHSFGSRSRTELEDSRAKTMGADSFSKRAKLLSWVAVTTHMLCVFTRGWTWTVMLCFSPYTKAVCGLCQNYFFWIGNNRGIFVSEHAVEESHWWLPLIEVNAKWLPVSTAELQHCTEKRKAQQLCTYLAQLACLNSNLILLLVPIRNEKKRIIFVNKVLKVFYDWKHFNSFWLPWAFETKSCWSRVKLCIFHAALEKILWKWICTGERHAHVCPFGCSF